MKKIYVSVRTGWVARRYSSTKISWPQQYDKGKIQRPATTFYFSDTLAYRSPKLLPLCLTAVKAPEGPSLGSAIFFFLV